MAHLEYLTKSCDGSGGYVPLCLPDNVQIGDTFTQTLYPVDGPPTNYGPRMVYATSNVACENSIFAINLDGSVSDYQLYSQPIKTYVSNIMPCPNCCRKPNLKPWDLYDMLPNGELSPNFPQETTVAGITFTKPTDQDYENAGCIRRCLGKAVIPQSSPRPLTGKEGGTEIQQKKDRKPGDPQTYLHESFKKRFQKLAGIKKSKK